MALVDSDRNIENEISFKVRGAVFKVYNALGPGLLESVYEVALRHELLKENLDVMCQVPVPVYYDGEKMDIGFRLDLLINGRVVVEIKSVEVLAPVHHKQVLTYLRLTNTKLGILVNFNTEDITKGIIRIVNKL